MDTLLELPCQINPSRLDFREALDFVSSIEEGQADCSFTLEVIKGFIAKLQEETKGSPREWGEIKQEILVALE